MFCEIQRCQFPFSLERLTERNCNSGVHFNSLIIVIWHTDVVKTNLFDMDNTKLVTNPTSHFTRHWYDTFVLSLFFLLIFIVFPMPYKIFSLMFLYLIITVIYVHLNIFHSLPFSIRSFESLTSCYAYYYNGFEHFLSCIHCRLKLILVFHCL